MPSGEGLWLCGHQGEFEVSSSWSCRSTRRVSTADLSSFLSVLVEAAPEELESTALISSEPARSLASRGLASSVSCALFLFGFSSLSSFGFPEQIPDTELNYFYPRFLRPRVRSFARWPVHQEVKTKSSSRRVRSFSFTLFHRLALSLGPFGTRYIIRVLNFLSKLSKATKRG